MKLTVSAAVAAMLIAAPAAAQDWTGLRAGIQGGFGTVSGPVTGSLDLTYNPRFGPTRSFGGAISEALNGAQGGEFGASIGYDWQFQNGLVLGAVADINKTTWKGASDPLITIGNCSLACSEIGSATTSVDWYGTVRAKLGQSIGNLLVYGTGGFAYANASSSTSIDARILGNSIYNTVANVSGVQSGWVAGAGAAIAINDRVSVRVEYLHFDLGNRSIYSDAYTQNLGQWVGSATLTSEVKQALKSDTIRVGLDFKIW